MLVAGNYVPTKFQLYGMEEVKTIESVEVPLVGEEKGCDA